ncbi:sensor histidine kinase [Acetatifactor muris]|jgi:signal transduction histidine kinase|uniref:sensor histidine kinase n=1 Tax=Acetatifactor muris TaxID=879566 RepID=UPI0023F4C01D|nr:HAMP domain-containing sensor histidine kinase [Acetatifactor muris]MCI8801486.1 HAMP domain-containing histidine kinase [Lachnospiraceae bacterium]
MIAKIYGELKNLISLRSLQARIFIIVLAAGFIPSVIVRYGIMNNYEERSVQQRIYTVQNQLMIVGNHLISNNYFNTKPEGYSSSVSREVIDAELEMISNLYEGRVMIIDSSLKVVKDTYGISTGKTIISEEVIKCFRGETLSNYDREHGYIEMTTPIIDNTVDDSQIVGVMLTSISTDAIMTMLEVLNRKSVILQNLMIVAIVAMAMVLSVMLTRPFNRVTEAINEVKAGYSDENISVPDYAETVHIVDAFNQLLKRMRALDDSRQEFVENVSHELKTPMAAIKVLADSLVGQREVPAELYQEFLTDIVSEIDRENQIITDLLALVKMDKKAQELNITSLNVNDLVELILKRLRPLARKKDVEVVFESIRPVVAEVDEVKMTLIMTNLVENAIKYNKEHGWVKVELDADHQFFTFKVSDSGLGIPEDSLTQIYERFYRVEKSHSREIGGTGLGLAITKSAVLMHRGAITVTSVEGEGSSFTVKIPLTGGAVIG